MDGPAGTATGAEITEAVLMQNKRGDVGALHQLRSLGVGIAMDDFAPAIHH